jgi:hypothetical protein
MYATVRRQIYQELAVSERRVRKDIEAYPVILAIVRREGVDIQRISIQ